MQSYEADAGKQPVVLWLDPHLVAKGHALGGDPSATVERLLADFVIRRERDVAVAVTHWNAFDAEHGSFADEYNPL